MRIKSQKDFAAGLLYFVVGVAFAWGATSYNIGSGARMGPGYFPLLLGVLLAVIGAVVTIKALAVGAAGGDRIGRWAWKPLLCIIGANILFGLLLGGLPNIGIPAMGLIAGIYGLTLLASLAGDKFSLKEALILATVLSVGSYFTFIVALKLQLVVWPTFIVG